MGSGGTSKRGKMCWGVQVGDLLQSPLSYVHASPTLASFCTLSAVGLPSNDSPSAVIASPFSHVRHQLSICLYFVRLDGTTTRITLDGSEWHCTKRWQARSRHNRQPCQIGPCQIGRIRGHACKLSTDATSNRTTRQVCEPTFCWHLGSHVVCESLQS